MSDKQPAYNRDDPTTWPLSLPPATPAYFRAVPAKGYGLGEHGTAIFTGCKLVPEEYYNRDVSELDDFLVRFGPETRLRFPDGISIGKRYKLQVLHVGHDDSEEVDQCEFLFHEAE